MHFCLAALFFAPESISAEYVILRPSLLTKLLRILPTLIPKLPPPIQLALFILLNLLLMQLFHLLKIEHLVLRPPLNILVIQQNHRIPTNPDLILILQPKSLDIVLLLKLHLSLHFHMLLIHRLNLSLRSSAYLFLRHRSSRPFSLFVA